MQNITKYVANKIKSLRENKNITQQELAEALGTTQQSIARYESGERKADQNILFMLAEYFKISINDFFPPIETLTTDIINDSMGTNYISETQLSLLTGIDISEIRSITSGKEKLPKPSSLIKIANSMKQDPYDFLICAGYVEDPNDNDNELYNLGIRFLLPEKERKVLCDYLEDVWNDDASNKITSSDIYKIMFETDKSEFSISDVKAILNIENNFNIKFDNAELVDIDSNTIKIPVFGTIKAGIPIESQSDIIEYVEIPKKWTIGGKKFYGLKISGDSMFPKYDENDIVIFEQNEDLEMYNGKDCAIMINGTESTFKKLLVNDQGIVLQPYNAAYDVMMFSREQVEQLPIKVVGIARAKRTKID